MIACENRLCKDGLRFTLNLLNLFFNIILSFLVTAHSVKEELKDLGMPLPVFFLNDTQLITQVDNITFNDADVEFEKYRSNLNGNTIIIFKGKRKPFLPISINRMMATTFTIVSWVMTDHEEFKFFQVWSGDSAVFELK